MLQRSWRESQKVSPAANFSSRWGEKLAVGGGGTLSPHSCFSWVVFKMTLMTLKMTPGLHPGQHTLTPPPLSRYC